MENLKIHLNYTKRNCILVQNKLEYFFLYQGKNTVVAVTSIFNGNTDKKK